MYSSCSLLKVKSEVPLHASHQQILWFEILIMSAAHINLIFSVMGLFKSSMSNSAAQLEVPGTFFFQVAVEIVH